MARRRAKATRRYHKKVMRSQEQLLEQRIAESASEVKVTRLGPGLTLEEMRQGVEMAKALMEGRPEDVDPESMEYLRRGIAMIHPNETPVNYSGPDSDHAH